MKNNPLIRKVLPKYLTKEEADKTKKYSILDASGYSVMYGFGEQYVPAYAIRLGATSAEVGLLSSIPAFISSLFQIVGAKLAEKYRKRKTVISLFVLFQALTLLPLFLLPFITKNTIFLTVLFSLYLLFGNISAAPWSSLMGDIVSSKERAEYFGKRNKVSIIVLFFSILMAGIVLNYFENINVWFGFGILFAVALLGRLFSYLYLTKHYEPQYVVNEKKTLRFMDFIKNITKSNFGNFVLYRSFFALAVVLASPFFTVYMLKNLNFNYIQYTTVVLVPMLVKFMTVQYWARYSEKYGTRNIMYVSIFLASIVPLAWLLSGYFFATKQIIFVLVIIAEAISGFGWGGLELTSFNYILETVDPEHRAKSFAYFNAIFGTGVLIGGLIGAFIAKNITDASLSSFGLDVMLFLFLISFLARAVVSVIFMSKIKEVKITRKIDQRELFFELALLKPIDIVSHRANSLLVTAEQELDKKMDFIIKPASRTMRVIFEPIESFINRITAEDNDNVNSIFEPIESFIERVIAKEKDIYNTKAKYKLKTKHKLKINHDSRDGSDGKKRKKKLREKSK